MNKADKITVVILFILGVSLFFTPRLWQVEGGSVAVVEYRGKELLRIDMTINDSYDVQGDLGPVTVEVKDRKIRVSSEESPYHYCSMQGWVSYTSQPIICLPNGIEVRIISGESSGADTTIQ